MAHQIATDVATATCETMETTSSPAECINVDANETRAAQIAHAQEIVDGVRGGDKRAQLVAIEQAIQHIYPYPSRAGQRDALWQLIYQRKDMILIAKTSFGKSMILQAVSISLKKKITIVILPLDRIGQQQSALITKIGGSACFLNANTISKKLLADIRRGHYTHILTSPELATGDKFHQTATDPYFK